MTDDLLKRAEPFLTQCGSCDYGVHVPCTCPKPNYRPVMLDLVREVERLRAVAANRCDSCDHEVSVHGGDGCWYTVNVGVIDRDSVCACSVPAEGSAAPR